MAVAAAARAFQLGRQDLWLDEALTLESASQPLGRIADSILATPPLFYWLLHPWTAVLGRSESCLRGLPAIFGVAGVLVLYWIGKRIFGRTPAFFSALLLALSPSNIAFSQELRPYTLLCLLSCLSFYLFSRSLDRGGKESWAGYVAATSALLYTHYWGYLIWAAELFYAAVRLKISHDRLKPLLAAQALLLCAVCLWLPSAHRQLSANPSSAMFMKPPSLLQALAIFPAWSGTVLSLGDGLRSSPALIAAASALWLLLIAAGGAALKRSESGQSWLLYYLLLPWLLGFAGGRFLPLYNGFRHTLALFPAACLLAGLGLASLGPAARMLALAGLTACSAAVLNQYYFHWRKSRAVDMAHFIRTTAPPGAAICFEPAYEAHPVRYYLGQDLAIRSCDASFFREARGNALAFVRGPGPVLTPPGWSVQTITSFGSMRADLVLREGGSGR